MSSVLRWIRDGQLPATRLPGGWRITETELNEFLARRGPTQHEPRPQSTNLVCTFSHRRSLEFDERCLFCELLRPAQMGLERVRVHSEDVPLEVVALARRMHDLNGRRRHQRRHRSAQIVGCVRQKVVAARNPHVHAPPRGALGGLRPVGLRPRLGGHEAGGMVRYKPKQQTLNRSSNNRAKRPCF
jgi:hypothetical protein